MARLTLVALAVALVTQLFAAPVHAVGPRPYRSAFVVVSTPTQSPGQVAQLRTLTEAIRKLFPTYWSAATSGLSIMDVAPLESLVDDANLISSSPNTTQTGAVKAYYAAGRPDDVEFITFFKVQDGSSFHSGYQTDETGIGASAGRSGSTPPGVSRLLGAQTISIPVTGLSYQPESWLSVLLHEYLHQWCCFINTPDGYGLDPFAFLTPDHTHWSSLLYLPPSPKEPMLGGNTATGGWTANPNGTYTQSCRGADAPTPQTYAYSKLDLYLMGLVGAVGWPIPDRPAIQQERSVQPGEYATFSFRVRGVQPGLFALHLRPVIDGVTWMEDEGVFAYINVR